MIRYALVLGLYLLLSKAPKRIDCSKVFNLEIERLKQEIEFLKMNLE